MMDLNAVSKLQDMLIDTRKILSDTIEAIYSSSRVTHMKYMMNVKFELQQLPDIPDDLLHILQKYENAGDEGLNELLEQIRIMVILAQKKNCKISKVIDAI